MSSCVRPEPQEEVHHLEVALRRCPLQRRVVISAHVHSVRDKEGHGIGVTEAGGRPHKLFFASVSVSLPPAPEEEGDGIDAPRAKAHSLLGGDPGVDVADHLGGQLVPAGGGPGAGARDFGEDGGERGAVTLQPSGSSPKDTHCFRKTRFLIPGPLADKS